MAGTTITVSSSLQCPHGGVVQIVTTNVQASADNGFIATVADSFMISGCPFQIPATPPIPSPCLTVQWIVPDARVRVSGNATLSQSSVGICMSATQLPQGPVSVVANQSSVSSL